MGNLYAQLLQDPGTLANHKKYLVRRRVTREVFRALRWLEGREGALLPTKMRENAPILPD